LAASVANPADRDRGYRRVDVPTSLSMLARLRARDDEGWRQCLALYTPLILRWGLRQGLAEPDAADVAQNVFHIIAEHIGKFEKDAAGGSFRGWLCRITHRAIGDLRRSRETAAPAGGTDAQLRLQEVPDRATQEPAPEEVVEETRYLYQKAVQAARAEFPERMWEIFWRVAVDGNPAPRVAEEFATTPTAVRQIKSRVLRRLKQIVGDLAD
jgi:RNA polymerase sigma-70 factor (ECF subfamily)